MVSQVERPPTLVLAAVNHLREAILHGEFYPGESLPEVHLSKIFKISRGTIREALRNLQEEGIVQIIAHRGAIVTELSAKKAEEIYTLRAQLEPYAVRLTMEKFGFSALDIHKLQSIVEELGELQQGDDPYAVVSIDMKFHRLVYNRCEHQLLLQVLGSLRSLTRLFILNTKIFQSDLTRDDISHQTILDSIRSCDPERAEDITKQHIIFAGKSLVKHMIMKSSSKSSNTAEKTI